MGTLDLTDAEVFGAFCQTQMGRVYGYFLRRVGGSVAVAEDLAQDTFLAAAAQVRRGARIDAPDAWLIGIARHKLVDHHREVARHERRLRRAEELADLGRTCPSDLVDDRVDAAAFLAGLPAMQRAAIVLHHMDGLPVPDVARALGRTVHATESLIARGKRALQRAAEVPS